MRKHNISESIKTLEEKGQKSLVLQNDQFQRPLVILNRLAEAGKAEQHDLAIDITHIIEGEGIIKLGGEIIEKTLRSPHEWRGEKLKGADEKKLAPGDVMVVKAGIAHRTLPNNAAPLVYITHKQYLAEYFELDKFEQPLLEKIRKIKGLIMDVDGTMTDGKVWVNKKGEEFASFSRIDSLALLPWQGMGRFVGTISREEVSIATARAKKLKIDCQQGILDKLAAAKTMTQKWGLNLNEVCFIGDDVNDMPLLNKVGFSACPQDAQPQVLREVDLVIPAKRGNHAIRQLMDLIFMVQLGKLPEVYERSWGEEYMKLQNHE